LKIENTSEFPVFISAKITQDAVCIKIYGQPLPSNVELKIRPVIEEELHPGSPQVTVTGDLPTGVRKTQESARMGYKVRVFRDYFENGILIKSEEISYDEYQPVAAKILQGSGTNK
jgi:vancomycin resistance protein YoaR